jgi:hypothetical protein
MQPPALRYQTTTVQFGSGARINFRLADRPRAKCLSRYELISNRYPIMVLPVLIQFNSRDLRRIAQIVLSPHRLNCSSSLRSPFKARPFRFQEEVNQVAQTFVEFWTDYAFLAIVLPFDMEK